MVDNFEVKKLYEDRPHERHRFSFTIDGKEFKGNFHEDDIQWLHPHPKQDVEKNHLEWIEAEVRRLLNEHDTKDELESMEGVEGIKVTPMLEDQSHEAHQFKLNIDGEEFKGMVRDGKLEWFHPKPRRKLKDARVDKVEEKVYQKMKEHNKD
ncbi:DUF5342 family protein [Virgibacillus halodenitrificans]|uniref:DUF5342 family protein n=1 Tax=Virgibacillus halodenitrificans TaxID=1482 RepID=UPI0007614905|nr:HicA family toxin-antitoxin system [Virgibacillus halodenitrificans]